MGVFPHSYSHPTPISRVTIFQRHQTTFNADCWCQYDFEEFKLQIFLLNSLSPYLKVEGFSEHKVLRIQRIELWKYWCLYMCLLVLLDFISSNIEQKLTKNKVLDYGSLPSPSVKSRALKNEMDLKYMCSRFWFCTHTLKKIWKKVNALEGIEVFTVGK